MAEEKTPHEQQRSTCSRQPECYDRRQKRPDASSGCMVSWKTCTFWQGGNSWTPYARQGFRRLWNIYCHPRHHKIYKGKDILWTWQKNRAFCTFFHCCRRKGRGRRWKRHQRLCNQVLYRGRQLDLVGNNTPVFFFYATRLNFLILIMLLKEIREQIWEAQKTTGISGHPFLKPCIRLRLSWVTGEFLHPTATCHGFGSHTFSMINAANERFWVKFHLSYTAGNKKPDWWGSRGNCRKMQGKPSAGSLWKHWKGRPP